MRALITGANGFLGSHLARRLVERGDSVRGLVRNGQSGALAGLPVELVEGDVTDPMSLLKACKGVEVVFHLAGIRRAPERELFFKVNADGTQNVCEAMLRTGAKRLVLAGSLAAAGPATADRPRIEEDPYDPQEAYGASKVEAERIAFRHAKQLEVTVARPPRITGPGDRENLVFFKIVKKGVLLRLAGGPRPLSTIDVDDCVEFFVLLAEKKEAVGEAFFACGPELTSLEGLQRQVAEVLGIKPRVIPVPERVLLGLSAGADWVSKLTGKHLPLNRKLAKQLLAPGWTCSGEKAERLLGYRPKVSLSDSIRRSAAWYQQQGWI
jgi:nucleoside-diphosphate-sugar epimerase